MGERPSTRILRSRSAGAQGQTGVPAQSLQAEAVRGGHHNARMQVVEVDDDVA